MDPSQREADILGELERRGWTVTRGSSREPLLPPEVSRRYPRIPEELIRFLESMENCINAEETVWFLCREDFRRGGEGFRWNEFELMTLEGGNAEQQQRIRAFWDRHFPFVLAVHSDYDYLAVSLDPKSHGQIVHGSGPEFEETTVVAPSFRHFLEIYAEFAASRRDDYPLSYFV